MIRQFYVFSFDLILVKSGSWWIKMKILGGLFMGQRPWEVGITEWPICGSDTEERDVNKLENVPNLPID